MKLLNYQGKNSAKFAGMDKPANPVSLGQYLMHYLYGRNEPALMRLGAGMLDKAEKAETEEEREKQLTSFVNLATGNLSKSLPHAVSLSQNAAKNVMYFSYYVEGATRGARIAVGPCICQKGLNRLPKGVIEVEIKDITLFYGADIYLNLGIGFREINVEEAIDILDEMHNKGYVHQASYMFGGQGGLFVMCNCDDSICSAVRGQRLTGRTMGKGPEICHFDENKCLGPDACGMCLKRCPFGVNIRDGNRIIFDRPKCMGCELCVTTCKGAARSLEIREDYELENVMSKNLLLAGKYGYPKLMPYRTEDDAKGTGFGFVD
jgi:ferredoxin